MSKLRAALEEAETEVDNIRDQEELLEQDVTAQTWLLRLGDLREKVSHATSLPRHCHVTDTSRTRHGHVTDTSRPRHGHVTDTSLPRHGHFTDTSLTRHGHVTDTSLPRH